MIATRMPYLRSCSSIGIAVCSITIDSDWRRSSITARKQRCRSSCRYSGKAGGRRLSRKVARSPARLQAGGVERLRVQHRALLQLHEHAAASG